MDPARLDGIPLFASLSAEERGQVAEWVSEVSFDAGRRLMSQDQFPVECFLIQQGTVEVVRDGEHIADLGPGDVVGEVALFGGWEKPRNATVTASTPLRAIRIDDRAFRRITRELPAIAEKMRATAAERAGPANDG